MSKSSSKGGTKSAMTTGRAAQITSTYAKTHGGTVPKGSFPARATSAGAKNGGSK